jgi:hypothetical protein
MADGDPVKQAAKRRAWSSAFLLAVLAVVASPAGAQAGGRESMLSNEQLEILRSLPPDQREALINQVLGSGLDSAGRRDRALEFPETVIPRQAGGLTPDPQLFGEPRFGAGDTLLLMLEIREFEGPDLPATPPAENAARVRIVRTPEEV